ncbi:hypothetical protein F4860DRAFT_495482 [Xylaria cubensis]|nr:hypothetical protein F4860DRAFT_495482 [Xylaria cubensis]
MDIRNRDKRVSRGRCLVQLLTAIECRFSSTPFPASIHSRLLPKSIITRLSIVPFWHYSCTSAGPRRPRRLVKIVFSLVVVSIIISGSANCQILTRREVWQRARFLGASIYTHTPRATCQCDTSLTLYPSYRRRNFQEALTSSVAISVFSSAIPALGATLYSTSESTLVVARLNGFLVRHSYFYCLVRHPSTRTRRI